jgi:predicted RNase H-like nuclease (RuvC/YqgF family)
VVELHGSDAECAFEMNKSRRAGVTGVEKRLALLKETISKLKIDTEDIKAEEEDAKENLPESLRDGEKGEAMDTNIENLESATEELDGIENSIEQAERYLQAAREGE